MTVTLILTALAAFVVGYFVGLADSKRWHEAEAARDRANLSRRFFDASVRRRIDAAEAENERLAGMEIGGESDGH